MLTYSPAMMVPYTNLPILSAGNSIMSGEAEDFQGAEEILLEYYRLDGTIMKRDESMSEMLPYAIVHNYTQDYDEVDDPPSAYFVKHLWSIMQNPHTSDCAVYAAKILPEGVRLFYRMRTKDSEMSEAVDVFHYPGVMRLKVPPYPDAKLKDFVNCEVVTRGKDEKDHYTTLYLPDGRAFTVSYWVGQATAQGQWYGNTYIGSADTSKLAVMYELKTQYCEPLLSTRMREEHMFNRLFDKLVARMRQERAQRNAKID